MSQRSTTLQPPPRRRVPSPRHRLRFRRPALATGLCEHTMQELCDRLDVFIRQREGRHRRAPAGGFRRPPLTTGTMSSPALSLSTSCDRSRFGPPSWPPRRSTPWHAAQLLSYNPFPRASTPAAASGRCCCGKFGPRPRPAGPGPPCRPRPRRPAADPEPRGWPRLQ